MGLVEYITCDRTARWVMLLDGPYHNDDRVERERACGLSFENPQHIRRSLHGYPEQRKQRRVQALLFREGEEAFGGG